MANVDAVVFDKTGTLTTGQLSLIGTEGTQDEAALLRVAAALGAASSHPVSRAATAMVPPAARAPATARLHAHVRAQIPAYADDRAMQGVMDRGADLVRAGLPTCQ